MFDMSKCGLLGSIQKATCAKEITWSPVKPKTDQFLLMVYWTKKDVLKFGIYLTFIVAIVTENGQQNRFEIEKLSFCTNFQALGDLFCFKELAISTATRVIQ